MKVSCITVCYNSEDTIRACISSIINQSYKNIEIIIIDGSSTDATVPIIEEVSKKRALIISEKDHGIYDAMNKGLQNASGDIIHFLNSDDRYASNDILAKVVENFQVSNACVCYGGINYTNKNDKILAYWIPQKFKKGSFSMGWHTPHPGFFARRFVYQKLGVFNIELKIAADFDLMMRFMENDHVQTQLLPFPIVDMRSYGKSSRLMGIIQGFLDIRRSFAAQKKSAGLFYFVRRYCPKIFRKIKLTRT